MIRMVHDGRLMHLLVDPKRVLTGFGVERGQRVLEVGCDPGFYTVPAAEIVGASGHVYAYDTNPYAAAYVGRKAANLTDKTSQSVVSMRLKPDLRVNR